MHHTAHLFITGLKSLIYDEIAGHLAAGRMAEAGALLDKLRLSNAEHLERLEQLMGLRVLASGYNPDKPHNHGHQGMDGSN